MSALGVIVLVVGVLAAVAVGAIGLMVLVGRRLKRVEDAMRAGVAADERFLLEPTVGNYRGATGRFGAVKGAAIVAVTDRRVLCHKAFGKPIEIPLAAVTDVREDRWFLRAYNGLSHLILQLRDGVEVGLQVRPADHARWLEGLRAAVGQGSSKIR
jgi:hypothetical protein